MESSRSEACVDEADAKALRAMENGDFRHALEVLVRAYQHRIVRFCTNQLRFAHLGEYSHDVAQEVFLGAYRTMPRFAMRSSICTWLYAIARKQCLKIARRHRYEARRKVEFEANIENTTADDPIEELEPRVIACLPGLPEKERRLVVMRYTHGLSMEQISNIEGISKRTVLRVLKKGLQRLREEVTKHDA
jgi:RNA polymerase sigma-70 factor (ECF subfamily)